MSLLNAYTIFTYIHKPHAEQATLLLGVWKALPPYGVSQVLTSSWLCHCTFKTIHHITGTILNYKGVFGTGNSIPHLVQVSCNMAIQGRHIQTL